MECRDEGGGGLGVDKGFQHALEDFWRSLHQGEQRRKGAFW